MLNMAVGQTLRNKKREQVRLHLEDAAALLFREKGFEETTVHEIADAAGVSARTLFRYFATKEDLVFEQFSPYLAALRGYIRVRPLQESDYEALKQALIEFGAFIEGHKAQTLAAVDLIERSPALRARRADEIRSRWIPELMECLQARHHRSEPRLRLRLIASTGWGVFSAAFDEWRVAGGEPRLPGVIGLSFDVLEREVPAPD